jgi:signal transduction histidine kinase
VVGTFGAFFQTGGNVAISLLATGLVAVIFQPLRAWMQRGMNRLLYGQRDEPYTVLSRLGQRLEATLAPEAVLDSIVETVRDALKLPYAALVLSGADSLIMAAASGQRTAEVLQLPVVYQQEHVGELQLGARRPGEGWSPADRRLLEDLARQVGVTAHAVQLTAELQRSRERLVSTREEERRRLRRDLHDDLAPTLAALALTAATARDRMIDDSSTAALLDELYVGLRAAVGDIRRIVYELRPPALDELGLVAAVRERAAQYNSTRESDGARLNVAVDAPDRLPALPAAVEVAAYRIVQDALARAARQTQTHSCTIRLILEEDGLELEVTDDGLGFGGMSDAETALDSMRARAVELGGRCSTEHVGGVGTRVHAWLPVAKQGTADARLA